MQHFHDCAVGVRSQHRRPHGAHSGSARLGGGFSLIELMVTVAVVAILLAIGVPAMQNFLTGRAVVSQAEELVSTFRLARSDALRLSSMVTVCASADTTDAEPTCSGATDWDTGWLSFIDVDRDGTRSSATERLLRVQAPLNSINGITSDTDGHVSFFPNGLPATGAAAFEIEPKVSTTSSGYNMMLRRVELNTAGRASILAGPEGS